MKSTICLSLLLMLPVLTLFGKITPTKLTCEYLQNPQVVDIAQPRLAWINIADEGECGQMQTAW
ncbi:MAG TPA: hypothetical protein VLA03_03410, partial [Draconibacterium sp.]|nr:hypothetical protein [Draconibacterium sp.]